MPGFFTRFALTTAFALAGCDAVQGQATRGDLATNPRLEVAAGAHDVATESEALRLVPIVDSFEFPWDIAFLDERELLVTEKPGRLSRVDTTNGATHPIAGVPGVEFVGQGGLLGVEVDPDFSENRLVYLAYSILLAPDARTTRVSRARLVGDRLVDLEVLFTAEPARRAVNHFGGALAFDRAGLLYVSVGDRQARDLAQDLANDLGKVHRIRTDGSAPDDNPFVEDPRAHATIYSWGHRNPQGFALHPETGALWSAEHGPQGGDEVNVIRPGRNYGWPIISYGEEYGGGKIGVGTHRDGLEQPLYYYVPSIAPSGIAFYSGANPKGGGSLTSWDGDLLLAALRLTHLNRLVLDGETVVREERLLDDLGHRVRAVAQSPTTGELFVAIESGTLFRIEARREVASAAPAP